MFLFLIKYFILYVTYPIQLDTSLSLSFSLIAPMAGMVYILFIFIHNFIYERFKFIKNQTMRTHIATTTNKHVSIAAARQWQKQQYLIYVIYVCIKEMAKIKFQKKRIIYSLLVHIKH